MISHVQKLKMAKIQPSRKEMSTKNSFHYDISHPNSWNTHKHKQMDMMSAPRVSKRKFVIKNYLIVSYDSAKRTSLLKYKMNRFEFRLQAFSQ